MPAHAGHPATSASSLSPYHHLSAPSTPQRSQVPQSPRVHYHPHEEPSPLTPRTIPMRRIPTPKQATSRLHVDQLKITGPPFFVVFNGQEPGVFTDWYVVSSLLFLIIGFSSIFRPFVLRSCKWKKGDWKKHQQNTLLLDSTCRLLDQLGEQSKQSK